MAISVPNYRARPVSRMNGPEIGPNSTYGMYPGAENLTYHPSGNINVPTLVIPPVIEGPGGEVTSGGAAAPAPVVNPFGDPTPTPAYLLKLLQGGLSPQDAAKRFNQETGRGYGNEAVYYGHNNTIGLPDAYLSTGANGWNIATRSPETGGGGGGATAPPAPQGWAKYRTPDGTPFADQVDPGLWKDEKGRTWAFLGPNGSLVESKVPGPAQPPTGGSGGSGSGSGPSGYIPGKGVAGMGSIFSEGMPAGPEREFYNQLLSHAGGGGNGRMPSPFAQTQSPDEFSRSLIQLLQQGRH